MRQFEERGGGGGGSCVRDGGWRQSVGLDVDEVCYDHGSWVKVARGGGVYLGQLRK